MKHCIVMAFVLLFTQLSHAAIRIEVRPDREVAYVGEPFILSVYVNGHGEPTPLDLSALEQHAAITKIGERSHNAHTTIIINGRQTIDKKFGYELQYQVTPRTAGRLKTGPVTATIDGIDYTGSGGTVIVKGIEKQDTVLLEMSSSTTNAVIYEPFTVTLSLLVRELTGEFKDTPPFFPQAAPRIQASYLDGINAEGLESKEPVRALQPYMVNRNQLGIRINNHTEPLTSMFGFNLSSRQHAHYQLPVSHVTRNGKSYLKYDATLQYMSTRPNVFTYGPVTVKGPFAEMRNGKPHRRSIFARAEALTVNVDYPPGAARPESFTGAVSTNLSVEAQLDLTTCQVGDPITLTLDITGAMNPDVIVHPSLSHNKNITDAYSLYEDSVTSTSIQGGKSFSYTLRPKTAGTVEFPAIEIGYYNPSVSEYRTLYSRAIPLRINEAHGITLQHVIGATTNQAVAAGMDRSAVAGIRLSENGTREEPVFSAPKFLLALLGGPILFLFVCLCQLAGRGVKMSGAAGVRRKALSQALQQLNSPTSTGSDAAIIRDYLGQRLGKDAQGLTPGGLATLLPGLSPDTLRNFEALYTECFNAEFSPAGVNTVYPDRTAIRELLQAVDKEIG